MDPPPDNSRGDPPREDSPGNPPTDSPQNSPAQDSAASANPTSGAADNQAESGAGADTPKIPNQLNDDSQMRQSTDKPDNSALNSQSTKPIEDQKDPKSTTTKTAVPEGLEPLEGEAEILEDTNKNDNNKTDNNKTDNNKTDNNKTDKDASKNEEDAEAALLMKELAAKEGGKHKRQRADYGFVRGVPTENVSKASVISLESLKEQTEGPSFLDSVALESLKEQTEGPSFLDSVALKDSVPVKWEKQERDRQEGPADSVGVADGGSSQQVREMQQKDDKDRKMGDEDSKPPNEGGAAEADTRSLNEAGAAERDAAAGDSVAIDDEIKRGVIVAEATAVDADNSAVIVADDTAANVADDTAANVAGDTGPNHGGAPDAAANVAGDAAADVAGVANVASHGGCVAADNGVSVKDSAAKPSDTKGDSNVAAAEPGDSAERVAAQAAAADPGDSAESAAVVADMAESADTVILSAKATESRAAAAAADMAESADAVDTRGAAAISADARDSAESGDVKSAIKEKSTIEEKNVSGTIAEKEEVGEEDEKEDGEEHKKEDNEDALHASATKIQALQGADAADADDNESPEDLARRTVVRTLYDHHGSMGFHPEKIRPGQPIRVKSVDPDTWAASHGFRPGDKILKLGETPMEDFTTKHAIFDAMGARPLGITVLKVRADNADAVGKSESAGAATAESARAATPAPENTSENNVAASGKEDNEGKDGKDEEGVDAKVVKAADADASGQGGSESGGAATAESTSGATVAPENTSENNAALLGQTDNEKKNGKEDDEGGDDKIVKDENENRATPTRKEANEEKDGKDNDGGDAVKEVKDNEEKEVNGNDEKFAKGGEEESVKANEGKVVKNDDEKGVKDADDKFVKGNEDKFTKDDEEKSLKESDGEDKFVKVEEADASGKDDIESASGATADRASAATPAPENNPDNSAAAAGTEDAEEIDGTDKVSAATPAPENYFENSAAAAGKEDAEEKVGKEDDEAGDAKIVKDENENRAAPSGNSQDSEANEEKDGKDNEEGDAVKEVKANENKEVKGNVGDEKFAEDGKDKSVKADEDKAVKNADEKDVKDAHGKSVKASEGKVMKNADVKDAEDKAVKGNENKCTTRDDEEKSLKESDGEDKFVKDEDIFMTPDADENARFRPDTEENQAVNQPSPPTSPPPSPGLVPQLQADQQLLGQRHSSLADSVKDMQTQIKSLQRSLDEERNRNSRKGAAKEVEVLSTKLQAQQQNFRDEELEHSQQIVKAHAEVSTSVAELQQKTTELQEKFTGLESNSARIASLAELKQKCASLESVQKKFTNLEENSASKTSLSELQKRLAGLESQAAMSSSVVDLNQRLAGLEALQSRFGTLESKSAADSSLRDLQDRFAKLEANYVSTTSLAALNQRIVTLEPLPNRFANLEATAPSVVEFSDLQTRLSNLENLEKRFVKLEADHISSGALQELQARFSNLESDFKSGNRELSAYETSINQKVGEIQQQNSDQNMKLSELENVHLANTKNDVTNLEKLLQRRLDAANADILKKHEQLQEASAGIEKVVRKNAEKLVEAEQRAENIESRMKETGVITELQERLSNLESDYASSNRDLRAYEQGINQKVGDMEKMNSEQNLKLSQLENIQLANTKTDLSKLDRLMQKRLDEIASDALKKYEELQQTSEGLEVRVRTHGEKHVEARRMWENIEKKMLKSGVVEDGMGDAQHLRLHDLELGLEQVVGNVRKLVGNAEEEIGILTEEFHEMAMKMESVEASHLRSESALTEQKSISSEHGRCLSLLQECMKDVESSVRHTASRLVQANRESAQAILGKESRMQVELDDRIDDVKSTLTELWEASTGRLEQEIKRQSDLLDRRVRGVEKVVKTEAQLVAGLVEDQDHHDSEKAVALRSPGGTLRSPGGTRTSPKTVFRGVRALQHSSPKGHGNGGKKFIRAHIVNDGGDHDGDGLKNVNMIKHNAVTFSDESHQIQKKQDASARAIPNSADANANMIITSENQLQSGKKHGGFMSHLPHMHMPHPLGHGAETSKGGNQVVNANGQAQQALNHVLNEFWGRLKAVETKMREVDDPDCPGQSKGFRKSEAQILELAKMSERQSATHRSDIRRLEALLFGGMDVSEGINSSVGVDDSDAVILQDINLIGDGEGQKLQNANDGNTITPDKSKKTTTPFPDKKKDTSPSKKKNRSTSWNPGLIFKLQDLENENDYLRQTLSRVKLRVEEHDAIYKEREISRDQQLMEMGGIVERIERVEHGWLMSVGRSMGKRIGENMREAEGSGKKEGGISSRMHVPEVHMPDVHMPEVHMPHPFSSKKTEGGAGERQNLKKDAEEHAVTQQTHVGRMSMHMPHPFSHGGGESAAVAMAQRPLEVTVLRAKGGGEADGSGLGKSGKSGGEVGSGMGSGAAGAGPENGGNTPVDNHGAAASTDHTQEKHGGVSFMHMPHPFSHHANAAASGKDGHQQHTVEKHGAVSFMHMPHPFSHDHHDQKQPKQPLSPLKETGASPVRPAGRTAPGPFGETGQTRTPAANSGTPVANYAPVGNTPLFNTPVGHSNTALGSHGSLGLTDRMDEFSLERRRLMKGSGSSSGSYSNSNNHINGNANNYSAGHSPHKTVKATDSVAQNRCIYNSSRMQIWPNIGLNTLEASESPQRRRITARREEDKALKADHMSRGEQVEPAMGHGRGRL